MKITQLFGVFAPMIAIGCGDNEPLQGPAGERGPAGEMGAPGPTGPAGPSSLAVVTTQCNLTVPGNCNVDCGDGNIAMAAGPMTPMLGVNDVLVRTSSGQDPNDPSVWIFSFATEGSPSVTTSAVCFTPPP